MRRSERHQVFPKQLFSTPRREKPQIQVSKIVVESAGMDAAAVYSHLATRPQGLNATEAAERLTKFGPNVLAKDQRPGILTLFYHAAINPLVVLLAVLATISFATGDARAGIVMSVMIAMGVGLKLIQEAKADNAAAGSAFRGPVDTNADRCCEGKHGRIPFLKKRNRGGAPADRRAKPRQPSIITGASADARKKLRIFSWTWPAALSIAAAFARMRATH